MDHIVFFDSECVLCGNFLKVLLRIDKKEKLKFASLQSDWSKSILPKELVQDSNYKTVAFLQEGKIYTHSDAVIKIFSLIGFPYNILRIGYVLPKKWRDYLYMKVSDNRYSWFGKSDNCLLPDQKLRARFVDELKLPS